MRGLHFSPRLRQIRLILLLLLGLPWIAAVEAQECLTPLEWQPKLAVWDRDANGNQVEDDIEALPPGDTIDILLDLNDCATGLDFARFDQVGTIGYVSRSISVVQMLDVTAADAVALGEDPRVAMVELDREVTVLLDVSNPAIRVRSSPTYSPDTLQDQFPTVNGTGVNIAILDTGVDDGQHESLPAAKFVGGFNAFTLAEANPDDDHGHGTHVAGIALGSAGTFRGIAPGAGLVDVKVLAANGSGSTAGVIAGIDWCILRRSALNIGVMNLSLGTSVPSNGTDALSLAVNRAVRAGIVAVVAAGNSGPASNIGAPAAADEAITVAASSDQSTVLRTDDVIASFSSRGPRQSDGDADTDDERKPDVTAPGVGIRSAQANTVSGYVPFNGTSMAAPHVAGLAALFLQAQPGTLPLSVKQRIQETAEDFGPAGWDTAWGSGLVNGLALFLGTCVPTDLEIVATGARNPRIVQGGPNFLRATVCNRGPATAAAFPVKLGLNFYSNSVIYTPVCTVLVPPGLAPGRCTVVECPWTPVEAGHRCQKAEIVSPCDPNSGNNLSNYNLNIESAHSPAEFTMKVVNPTGEDLDIEVLADLEPKCGGWTFTQSHTNLFLGAAVCPTPVDFSLTPLAGTTTSCRVGISIQGLRPDGTRIPLSGGILLGAVPETVRPFCSNPVIGTNSQGRRTVTVTLQDTASGIAQVNVMRSDNLDTPHPALVEGTNDVVTVTAAKVVAGQSGILELEVHDAAGNVTRCDPVLVETGRETGRPVTHTLTGIPAAEHKVTLYNGNPGIANLRLEVNGQRFQLGGLRDGELREIDVASAMRPGNGNTVQWTVLGQPGGEAVFLLHD